MELIMRMTEEDCPLRAGVTFPEGSAEENERRLVLEMREYKWNIALFPLHDNEYWHPENWWRRQHGSLPIFSQLARIFSAFRGPRHPVNDFSVWQELFPLLEGLDWIHRSSGY
jgi:hypothetical protein